MQRLYPQCNAYTHSATHFHCTHTATHFRQYCFDRRFRKRACVCVLIELHQLQSEYRISPHTVADWGMFCREVMLVYLECNSSKIGGPNKTVEIDESKFGRRKYHRGHPVKGQWVFGAVERESGQTFLVPVQDRTAYTLLAIIRDWIEPGTRVIFDCWGAYNNLGSLGYEHRTVNHSINFRDPVTGDHTNTTEGTWSRVKVFLDRYNRGGGLPLPSGTLLVRGEVQGPRNISVHSVPASRR
jgi:hypothetical protein